MIREATEADIEDLLVLGWEMHQESRYSSMSYDLEKVTVLFLTAIQSDSYIFLVAENDGVVIGGFLGCVMPQWFSTDLCAYDFSLFIHKDFRGGSTAAKLAKKYVSWATAQGVNPENISAGITTGVQTEKTTKLYEAIGFKQSGVIMSFKGDR